MKPVTHFVTESKQRSTMRCKLLLSHRVCIRLKKSFPALSLTAPGRHFLIFRPVTHMTDTSR